MPERAGVQARGWDYGQLQSYSTSDTIISVPIFPSRSSQIPQVTVAQIQLDFGRLKCNFGQAITYMPGISGLLPLIAPERVPSKSSV